MILSADAPIVTTIERYDVEPEGLDDAVRDAQAALLTEWRNAPAFVAALLLRGTKGGLAVYAQWGAVGDERPPASARPERTLKRHLGFPLLDGRTYDLAFTRQAPGIDAATRLSCRATPFIHFGVFVVTKDNQPRMIDKARDEAPNSFGTPGLLAIDFHRSVDGLQVVNLGAWSTFEGFETLHRRPGFKPGEQYFRGIAEMFTPEFYTLAKVVTTPPTPGG